MQSKVAPCLLSWNVQLQLESKCWYSLCSVGLDIIFLFASASFGQSFYLGIDAGMLSVYCVASFICSGRWLPHFWRQHCSVVRVRRSAGWWRLVCGGYCLWIFVAKKRLSWFSGCILSFFVVTVSSLFIRYLLRIRCIALCRALHGFKFWPGS